jgi:ABC-type multidrug transport system fused ATPase/permease subunit
MFDPTKGTILLDGEQIQSYRMADLRRSIAILTQEHHLFPLSLKENIGLGNLSSVDDQEMVKDAAEKGGATGVIKKLDDGFDTTLDPMGWTYGSNLEEDPENPLQKALEKLEKKIEVSGGERQRLVASRTFMRFTTGSIKLVLVDEPSSALDPEGEQQLFNNLIASREGKTMIFVTHRFGHLTKHADMIM